MELIGTSALYLVVLYLSIALTIYLVRKTKSGDGNKMYKVPPGKAGFPIIGETLDFAMAIIKGAPWKFVHDRMSRYSPDVFRTSLLGENIAVFCGAAGNKFIFSSENKCVASWWPSSVKRVAYFPEADEDSVMSLEEGMGKVRGPIHNFLKLDAVQHYIPIMDLMLREHLEAHWLPYKEVRACPMSKKYTFSVACRLFLRMRDPEQVSKLAAPYDLVFAGLLSTPVNFPGTAFNKAIKAGKTVTRELRPIIKKRKEEIMEGKGVDQKDMLSRLLLAEVRDGKPLITDSVIAANIMMELVAGHDTTSTAITFVVNYLAEYPDVYEKVLKEQMEIASSKDPDELLNWDDIQKMKYSWMVACETIRLQPPSPGAYREAIKDFTYSGFTIPKGWKAHWTVYSTHRDPKCFPDPEKFDPSRFDGSGPAPFTFVPFGGGPRMCAGKEFARVQILIFIHNLVTRFRWKKAIPDEKIIYNLNPVPARGLPIILEPHT